MSRPGAADLSDRLKRISEAGDFPEKTAQVIDFEVFRPVPEEAVEAGRSAKEKRPDPSVEAARKDADVRRKASDGA